MKFRHIPLWKIVTAGNIREEIDEELGDLMQSIELYDVLQPALVVPKGDKYELVTGHRRFAAMKARNEPTLPCIIRDDLEQADRVFVQLIENSQRKPMSAAEYVTVFDRLKASDPKMNNKRIGQLIGHTQQWVQNQYVAMTYLDRLAESGVDTEELRRMPAGTIIGRAQKRGVTGPKEQPVRDVQIKRSGRCTMNIVCRNEQIYYRVEAAIKKIQSEIREQEADACPV